MSPSKILKKSLGILCLLTFFMYSCQPSTTHPANDYNYYLELTDSSDLNLGDSLLPKITSLIQGNKYAITYQSQSEWPFFQTFNAHKTVSRDSLLPPHTGTHYFPNSGLSKANEGDYKVQVIFLPLKNDLLNFNQLLFQKKDGKWTQIVNTGNHSVTLKKQKNTHLAGASAKIIVRYSFK